MSRKRFVESHGATCKNWIWSWSFINEKDRLIIFGAWDRHTEGDAQLILSRDWEFNYAGRRNSGYDQAREHLRRVEEDGFRLMTFPLIYSAEKQDADGYGPAKIEGFIEKLSPKVVRRVGDNWYAADPGPTAHLPEEVVKPEQYSEGTSKMISVNIYERNSAARMRCIARYGFKCAVCSFSFADQYGEIGSEYIHVHHLVPLGEIKREYRLDPIRDLRPICPNCHAMIHRTQPALTIEQLRQHLESRKRA